MKTIILLIVITLFFFCCKEEDKNTLVEPLPTPTYTLNLSSAGNGTCEAIPNKNEYAEGDSVKLIATADSGYEFTKWDGSIDRTSNPTWIVMNREMVITGRFEQIIFMQTNITGKWSGVQINIELDLVQNSPSPSVFSGEMVLITNTGDVLFYAVSGFNEGATIVMECYKQGYYSIWYQGTWSDSETIFGIVEENNVQYRLDFVKVNNPSFLNSRSKIRIGKKIQVGY